MARHASPLQGRMNMTKMRGDRRRARLPRFAVALAFVILAPAHAVATALANAAAAAVGTFDQEDIDSAPGFKTVQAAPPPAKPSASTTTPKPAAPAAAPRAAAAQPPKPSAAALALKPGDVAGRYSIEREGDKDTGCMLTFEVVAKGQRGSKAVLAPGCRDQGIIIFDPAGWRLADGRLVLVARRGYSTHLDLQANGSWLKDPKEGKPLILKKM